MRWARRLSPPAPLTLATIVCVPELEGYWSESLEVLATCLESLRRTTPAPFELMVLDNGSCDPVRSFLQDRFAAGEVHQLFLSRRNLGKVGGWNVLFAAAGGELVAYTDSDVYFLPGWLEASRAVLEAFPEAAMVTAQPIPGDLSRHCGATLAGAAADPTVDTEEGTDLIAPHFVVSHRRGLGETREQYAERLRRRRDVKLRRGGTAAWVSASHFQFLSRRETLARFFPLPTHLPLGDDPEFDARLDAAGCWRLSTVDYLVHHLGNRRPDLGYELPWLDAGQVPATAGRPPAAKAGGWKRRLAESPRFRRLLKALHRRTYELLYPD
jgi:glycosyltransferase involved in cell wall biosynthesis